MLLDFSISDRLCVMIMIVLLFLIFLRTLFIVFLVSSSMDFIASSNNKIGFLFINALAKAIFCLSPPDNSCPDSPTS
jgi:hypothetical protein